MLPCFQWSHKAEEGTSLISDSRIRKIRRGNDPRKKGTDRSRCPHAVVDTLADAPTRAFFSTSKLLQNDLVAFLQTAQDFSLRSIRNPDVDGNLALAFLTFLVGNLHRGLLVFVVQDRAFGDLQHVLVLFQDDLGVGRHSRFQFAARIIDRDADLERRDVIFFHAHRRDLGDLTVKRLVLERLDLDARRLSEIHLADIALVNLAFYIDFAG